jgi:hypothetical protein
MDSKQIFLELYQEWQKYHYQKDWLIWTVTITYLGFSGLAARWLVSNTAYWINFRSILSATLGVVCIGMTLFVWFQNWYKVGAVAVTRNLDELMKKFDNEGPLHEELRDALNGDRRKLRLWKDGTAGIVLCIMMLLIGAAQVMLVFCYPGFARLPHVI